MGPAEQQQYVSRDAALAGGKNLKEKDVATTLGTFRCRELSGNARAEVIEAQANALTEEEGGKRVDVKGYQRNVIVAGVIDPASPDDDRQPLLKATDMTQFMQNGSSVIVALVQAIEELSGLGQFAAKRAEGNSDAGQS